MKSNPHDKNLEAYKVFPYLAWVVTFSFALFVYSITLELKTITTELQTQTQLLQEKVGTPINEITDFET